MCLVDVPFNNFRLATFTHNTLRDPIILKKIMIKKSFVVTKILREVNVKNGFRIFFT